MVKAQTPIYAPMSDGRTLHDAYKVVDELHLKKHCNINLVFDPEVMETQIILTFPGEDGRPSTIFKEKTELFLSDTMRTKLILLYG